MISASFKLNKSDSFDLCTVYKLYNFPFQLVTGFVVLLKLIDRMPYWFELMHSFWVNIAKIIFYSKTTVYKLNINEGLWPISSKKK